MELRCLHIYRSPEIDMEVNQTTIGNSVIEGKKTQMLTDFPTWFEEIVADDLTALDDDADVADADVVTADDAVVDAVAAEEVTADAVVDAEVVAVAAKVVAATKRGRASGSLKAATAVPSAPTIGVGTAGNTEVSVPFTAPKFTNGSAITAYTVTSDPGAFTGTGAASPIVVTGLTNATAYTFTVVATNGVGDSAASAASAEVTPVGA